MADSDPLPSSPSSSASDSANNPDANISSEELEQPISAQNLNPDSVDTIPAGRNNDHDLNQPSHEFKHPFVLTWLEEQDLVPGTGKIGENYNKDEKQPLQDSGKYDEKRQLQDSGKNDAIRLPRKVRKLEGNQGKKYNKDEKRPLLVSGKHDEILPRKVRKSNGNNNVIPGTDSYLARLNSDEETQIMLLIGMIEYHRINGVYPFEDIAALQDFINVVLLEENINLAGLQAQIGRLWIWYDVNERNFVPENEGERELFELAESIWGVESVQDPAPNFYPAENPGIINELQEYQVENPEILNVDYEVGPENVVTNELGENQVENPEIMNNYYEAEPNLNIVKNEVEKNQESFRGHVEHTTEEERESIDLAGIIWDREPEDVPPLNFMNINDCEVEDPWFMNIDDCEAEPLNVVNNELEEKQEESFQGENAAGKSSSQEKKDSDEDDVCKAGSSEAAGKEDATEAQKQEESFQDHDAAGESSSHLKNDATESTGN